MYRRVTLVDESCGRELDNPNTELVGWLEFSPIVKFHDNPSGYDYVQDTRDKVPNGARRARLTLFGHSTLDRSIKLSRHPVRVGIVRTTMSVVSAYLLYRKLCDFHANR